MSLIQEFVQQQTLHKHIPTDKKGVGNMTSKNELNGNYAATYHFGNTICHVVAPSPMSEDEKNKRVHDFYKAAWEIVKELNNAKY